MKLIRAIQRAEVAAVRSGALRRRAEGICWTRAREPVELGVDESAVVDVEVLAVHGGRWEEGKWVVPIVELEQVERVVREGGGDRGRVMRGGVQIGEVVEALATVLTIQYFDGLDPTAPVGDPPPAAAGGGR